MRNIDSFLLLALSSITCLAMDSQFKNFEISPSYNHAYITFYGVLNETNADDAIEKIEKIKNVMAFLGNMENCELLKQCSDVLGLDFAIIYMELKSALAKVNYAVSNFRFQEMGDLLPSIKVYSNGYSEAVKIDIIEQELFKLGYKKVHAA